MVFTDLRDFSGDSFTPLHSLAQFSTTFPMLTVPPLFQNWGGTVATFTKRGDGWRAQVRKAGMAPKSKTFPTKAAATEWATRIEREHAMREARGETETQDMTLREAIRWYEREVGELTKWGRSKAADLARLQGYELAGERVAGLRVQDFVRHAEKRRRDGAGPATVGNDLIWLRQVLKSARASLGVKADIAVLDDAAHELRQRRLIAKPQQRERRITPAEESALLSYFDAKGGAIPMGAIMRFALLSARRQEEITRIRWGDVDKATSTAWLDDVKHPTRKVGNRRQFKMLREALAIVETQPVGEFVFPYNPKTIGAYFHNACKMLGIEDLVFHDLRHEATSRLFERGYSIQEVAQFTLHESWATLKRYTHLKPAQVQERP